MSDLVGYPNCQEFLRSNITVPEFSRNCQEFPRNFPEYFSSCKYPASASAFPPESRLIHRWGDPNLCLGAAAQNPGVPLMSDAIVVEQPANLSTLTHRMDEVALDFLAAHASTSTSPFSQWPKQALFSLAGTLSK